MIDKIVFVFGWQPVGYGKCIGDTMWASIWCWTYKNDGNLHAKIMDYLGGYWPFIATFLYLGNSPLEACWTD